MVNGSHDHNSQFRKVRREIFHFQTCVLKEHEFLKFIKLGVTRLFLFLSLSAFSSPANKYLFTQIVFGMKQKSVLVENSGHICPQSQVVHICSWDTPSYFNMWAFWCPTRDSTCLAFYLFAFFKGGRCFPEMSKASFLLGKDPKDYFSDMWKGQRIELLKLLIKTGTLWPCGLKKYLCV